LFIENTSAFSAFYTKRRSILTTARGSRVLAGKKSKLKKFANLRTYYPSFAGRQVPDVGGELRIFTDSETAFIAFGDYMDMAKALATNLEPKDLNKRLSVVKIPD
jgi:hypothetical protein